MVSPFYVILQCFDGVLQNKSQSSGSQLFVECRGPSNTFLIVEAFTEKHKWCRQELARILKKYGYVYKLLCLLSLLDYASFKANSLFISSYIA